MRYRTKQKLDMYAFGGLLAAMVVGLWWFFFRYV